MVVVISALCLGTPPKGTGTNGAGAFRTWTAYDGENCDTLDATFISIRNGVVTLAHSINYQFHIRVSPYKPNRIRHETIPGKVPVQIPLAMLSASDRRWIEDQNPIETCLNENSKQGDVGTLAPKEGSFFIQKIMDDDLALVEYTRRDKIVWVFCLQSKLVAHLNPLTQYEAITCDLVPDFDRLSPQAKQRYCVDFRIEKKIPKNHRGGKELDLVEDYR